ncbi:MAG: YfhO family protein [Cyclobacteriaceae bacterium]|nr:YfhO family protein [Cyclobacteriaceae bacterium]
MNNSNFRQRILPHIISVLVFFTITIIYFHPIVFEGKVIRQNDIFQGIGGGQELVEFRDKTGEEGLWTNGMFSGMPAYLVNLYWSGGAIIEKLQSVLSLFLDQPLRETFLALISFYVLLLVFKVRPYLALAGAIAYAFSTFFLISIEAGHIWKVRAMAYMPAVLAGVHLCFRRKYIPGFLLTAFALALEINSNHLQITYYLFLIILVYGLVNAFFLLKDGKPKELIYTSAVLLLAAVLAMGTSAGKLWSTAEYGKYSIRGQSELSTNQEGSSGGLDRDYAFRWSSGIMETFTYMVPNLYGGASGQVNKKNTETSKALRTNGIAQAQARQFERGALGYWGDQPFTSGPIYLGASICFLFVLALFFVEKKVLLWLLPITVLSVMLSWGSNFEAFNYFMFDYFPGYNKFRSVTMTVAIATLTFPLASVLALENLISRPFQPLVRKKFLYASGISAGIVLIIFLFPYAPGLNDPQIPEWLNTAVKKDRTSIVRSDALRSLFFIVSIAMVWYLQRSEKIKLNAAIIATALLITLDLALLGTRYLNADSYMKGGKSEMFRKSAADEKILQDEDKSFRVFSLQNPFNEARTSYFHKSIGGYHGAKMRRYQDIIERYLEAERIEIIQQQGKLVDGLTPLLNMLNARYFVAGDEAESVIRNPYAMGNAWFVDNVKAVNNPDEEIDALSKTDLDQTAIVDVSKFNPDQNRLSGKGSITLESYQPNYIKYSSQNQEKGLAVFSEIYYPEGWSVIINGKPGEIIRANYLLRAVELPAGANSIEFQFAPASYAIGNTIMMISSILLLLLTIAAIVYFLKYKNA